MNALLVGCHELRKLEGSKVIIEGDSFSAIQWSLGNCSYPWRLADAVEEVQEILSQLDAVLYHVLCEANVSTDNLSKEAVLRSSLSFDVQCVLSVLLFFVLLGFPLLINFTVLKFFYEKLHLYKYIDWITC